MPNIDWQAKRAVYFSDGLKALGLPSIITDQRHRVGYGPAILFGTTYWREIEKVEGPWLLVDRASYGDPDFVQLGWNGHGRRGDHRVGDVDETRAIAHGLNLWPEPEPRGENVVLCGQRESYSPDWSRIADWYDTQKCTHFRPHPYSSNPTELPQYMGFDVAEAVTLNSSVAFDFLRAGVPVRVMDEGGMAFCMDESFFSWIAHTQWTWEEIRSGFPIGHLFIDRGL